MDRFNRILLLVIALAALVLPYLTRQCPLRSHHLFLDFSGKNCIMSVCHTAYPAAASLPPFHRVDPAGPALSFSLALRSTRLSAGATRPGDERSVQYVV